MATLVLLSKLYVESKVRVSRTEAGRVDAVIVPPLTFLERLRKMLAVEMAPTCRLEDEAVMDTLLQVA